MQAAQKYLKKYYELGGTKQGLRQSLKSAHPLTGIPLKYRRSFRTSLSPEDDARVKAGLEWYKKTYGVR